MYHRQNAVQYAERYWNSPNPKYRYFSDDCTNFISQVLHAGGFPMEFTGSQTSGWWYLSRGGNQDQWSYSWTVAHSLYHYLNQGKRAKRVEHVEQLELGDVICYDWEGDGRWNHNTVVTLIDAVGIPFVTAHTVNSHHRYWGYQDSSSFTDKTRYAFFHII